MHKVTIDSHEKTQKFYQYTQDSELTPVLPFLLSSLRSGNYCDNAEINLKISLTNIKWTNIPVGYRDALLCHDQICDTIGILGAAQQLCVINDINIGNLIIINLLHINKC